ncbi:MAG: response regulator [Bacteroidota bacterium]
MDEKIIMCVDDEKVVLTSLVSQLKNTFGDEFEYETFMSADDGWEFIDEIFAEGGDIELIICDWLMPRVRGDEFLIRVHQRFPDVPMIMLSGHADESAVQRAKNEANLFRFVAKPWVKEELMDVVKQALGMGDGDTATTTEDDDSKPKPPMPGFLPGA